MQKHRQLTTLIVLLWWGLSIPYFSSAQRATWNVEDSIKTYIEHARVHLFYSMSTGNSRNELLDASYNLTSAIKLIDATTDLDSMAQKKFKSQIQHLSIDIDSRLSIARDNLNYKLPLYDVMYGHRDDLNTVDEYTEILVEDLCQDLLNQPSDYRSTWNIPSVYTWVVFKQAETSELYNVAIEFLSENSNQYVIQLMEYPEGFFSDSDSSRTPAQLSEYAKSFCSQY